MTLMMSLGLPERGTQPWPVRSLRARLATTLAVLALLAWGIGSQAQYGLHGRHLVAAVLATVGIGGWALYVVADLGRRPRASAAVLCVVAAAGGGLMGLTFLGYVLIAFAPMAEASQRGLKRAGVIMAAAVAGMAVGLPLLGSGFGGAVGGVAAALAGGVGGDSRRQSHLQATQAGLLQVEKDRAELESQRAELLAERNRIAREVHDVLAHTLSALAVQLEALDSVVEGQDQALPRLRQQVQRSQALVREGLSEARRAVHALRSDGPPLVEQLERLAQVAGASFGVTGAARALAPAPSHALYRAAQESLANVAKHSAGSAATICLAFEPVAVRLIVSNPLLAPIPGPSSGGTADAPSPGFGLQGMRERAQALGGRATAGPHGDGWRVEVELPA